ncbi:MAG: hypothetical protein HRT45_09200 [Bdellovibrionales bacterium]|nr:hypothetical protein [Bdellovibrionales bacterium]
MKELTTYYDYYKDPYVYLRSYNDGASDSNSKSFLVGLFDSLANLFSDKDSFSDGLNTVWIKADQTEEVFSDLDSEKFNSMLRMLLRKGPGSLPQGTTVFMKVPFNSMSDKTRTSLFEYLRQDQSGTNRLVMVMSELELQDIREMPEGLVFLKKTNIVNMSQSFDLDGSI